MFVIFPGCHQLLSPASRFLFYHLPYPSRRLFSQATAPLSPPLYRKWVPGISRDLHFDQAASG